MKLKKFRIKNYKSIVDSGDCYFSDKFTILAGKNESGKTTILEALEDFHEDRVIRESAVPIGNEVIQPEIMVTFHLTKADLKSVFNEAGLTATTTSDVEITLHKKRDRAQYYLSDEDEKAIGLESYFSEAYNAAKHLITTEVKPKYATQTLAAYGAELKTFAATLPPGSGDVAKIDSVTMLIDKYTARSKELTRFVSAFVKDKLPYFILFSSFDDSFPDEITVEELETSVWAEDLENVSNFNRKSIASTNKQLQASHQRTVNTEFTDKFKQYWSQDKISLEVIKNDTINFWIIEDDVPHMPSQRSQGQRWYLSFFIKIVARISENKPNVILIDEPGLFLHARAQKDLLTVLQNHTSSYPIVFSTHSPYLITEDNLENVRLVEKTDRKTTVLGKIHAHKTADKETLTPILTAIGLGVNDSITNIAQKNNTVVEGPEDVFYLQAFKLLLPQKKRPDTNFVNGGGAGKMGTVGAILEGWGANVWYLFDNDQGLVDGSKALKDTWKVLPDAIKKVCADDDSTTADVLSIADFKKYVIENEAAKYTTRNSTYIKKNGLEKVLLARQFLQKVKNGGVVIDSDTLAKIEALFDEIKFSS